MTRILALDVATQTGVAFAKGADTPEFRTEILGPPRSTHAVRCAEAMRMTNRLITRYQPDILAIEAPYLDQRSPEAAALLYSLRGAIIGMAKVKGLHTQEFSPSKVRSHFIQNGSLGRAEAKSTVFDTCKMLGWNPRNNDESDAGAVLEMARAEAKISRMMPAKGLFRVKR